MAEKNDKPVKRMIKNPETFRERAVKAAEEGDKPTRTQGAKTVAARVTQPVKSLLNNTLGRLFRTKPFQLIGKVIFPKYLRTSWHELKQVKWPNLQQGRQLTFAVLVFAVIFGVTIAVVDYGLDKIFRNVLLK
jgi:preprotein translocase SecE subunit